MLVPASRSEPLSLGPPPRSPLTKVESESWLANHTRGQLAVGGRLSLLDDRLVFVPNWVERVLRRPDWTCELAAITGVGVADRGLSPFSGALRQRLVVRDRRRTTCMPLGLSPGMIPPFCASSSSPVPYARRSGGLLRGEPHRQGRRFHQSGTVSGLTLGGPRARRRAPAGRRRSRRPGAWPGCSDGRSEPGLDRFATRSHPSEAATPEWVEQLDG